MDQTYLKKIWQKGMNALENGDFTKAINYLKKVSKGQPDNLDVLLVLADALAADKQFDNSIRHYQILAKKNPDSLCVSKHELGQKRRSRDGRATSQKGRATRTSGRATSF